MKIRSVKKERQILLIILWLFASLSFVFYQLGLRHCKAQDPQIITKIEYIDDKCLCVKCSKRLNFQEVQNLIAKINE